MNEKEEVNEGDYLEEIEDGAGCVEIWERLSEARSESKSDNN